MLFAALARNGMSIDDGPVGMMLEEHDRARELTAGLGKAAAGGPAASAPWRTRWPTTRAPTANS